MTNRYILTRENLPPRKKQILEDPNCPDVTKKEIKTLITRFRQDRMFEEAEILKELNGENALAELMSKKK